MSAEVDIGPLVWVKGEVDASLARADEAFTKYAANTLEAEPLRFALTHLHQACGALSIVGLDGVTQYAEALELMLGELEKGAAVASHATLDLVHNALAALRHYLDELVGGAPNQPLKLWPLYEKIQLARGLQHPSASDLFFPDLGLRPPKREDPAPAPPEDPAALMRAARTRFERGFLQWFRSGDGNAGLADMRAALDSLERSGGNGSARNLWWVALAVVDGIAARCVPTDMNLKRLWGRIGTQLRRVAGGSRTVAERLMRDALYYAAISAPATDQIRAVQEAYALQDLVPRASAGPDIEPLRPVLRGLREMLQNAKDAWNRFCAGAAVGLPQFAEQAAAIATRTEGIPNPDLVALAAAVRDTASWLRRYPLKHGDSSAMEVATALLLIETAADTFEELDPDFPRQAQVMVQRLTLLRQGAPLPPMEAPLLGEMSQRAQEKLFMSQVAREILNNLAVIEQALDTYFRDPSRSAELSALTKPIKQVEGALAILGQERAVELLRECEGHIAEFLAGQTEFEQKDFEGVAHKLSGLGFFVEALQHGPADLDQILNPRARGARAAEPQPVDAATVEEELRRNRDEAQALADELSLRPADGELRQELKANLESIREQASLIDDAQLEQRAKDAIAALSSGTEAETAARIREVSGVAAPPAPAPGPVAAPATEEEVDAELLGIFIEEAAEVLDTIGSNLERCRDEPHNHDVLTTIRRGFHTLKGSGRMVGLKEFGEAAWGLEQVMNRWLQLERDATPELQALIADAHALLSAWVVQLREGGSTHKDASALLASAGRMMSDEAPPPPVAELAPAAEAIEEVVEELEELEEELPAVEEAAEPAAIVFAPEEEIRVGERVLSRTLFDMYTGEVRQHVGTLRRELARLHLNPGALPSGDTIRAAHTLAGISATVGFDQIHDLARALEHAMTRLARDGLPATQEDTEAVNAAASTLEAMERAVLDRRAPATSADLIARLGTVAPAAPEPTMEELEELSEGEELEAVPAPAEQAAQEAEAPVEPLAQPAEPPEFEAAETVEAIELEPIEELEAEPVETVAQAPAELAGEAPVEALEEAPVQAVEEAPLAEIAPEPAEVTAPEAVSPAEAEAVSGVAPAPAEPAVELPPEARPASAEAVPAGEIEDEWLEAAAAEAAEPELIAARDEEALAEGALAEAPEPVGATPVEAVPSEAEAVAAAPATPAEEPAAEVPAGEPREPAAAEAAPQAEGKEFVPVPAGAPEEPERTLEQIAAESGIALQPMPLEEIAREAAEAPMAAESAQIIEFAPLLPAETPVIDHVVAREEEPAAEGAEKRRMRLQDDIDETLLPIFLEEAQDLMREINANVRHWHEAPGDTESPKLLKRLLHTLKGSARMAGAMGLGELVHSMETRVEDAVARQAVTPRFLEEFDGSLDRCAMLIERLRAGPEQAPFPPEAVPEEPAEAEAAPLAEAAAPAPAAMRAPAEPSITPQQMLRVRADLVDRFVNEAGEISIARSRIEGEMRVLRASLLDLTENVIRLRNQLRELEIQAESQMQSRLAQAESRHGEFDPLEFDRFTRLQELTRMIAESVNDVSTVQHNLLRNLDGADVALNSQARLNRDLQQALMSVRLVPFASQADRLHRVVRQTAKELGRKATLDIRGGQVELDRGVLDKMVGPLEHLLRNAVSHGIEGPETRAARGKPDIGEIAMSLSQEGNEVIIDLADDGGGLDLERIRTRAVSLELIEADAQVDPGFLGDLIFRPGFSTATEVSEISGRGVGMDVVKSAAQSLGGRIEVSSEAGAGTRFRIFLPMTLALMQTLLARVAGRTYAVPSSMVEQVLELKTDALERVREEGVVAWQGNRYPYRYLPRLLGDDDSVPPPGRYHWLMLVRGGGQRVAVQVDELRGNQEVVIKKTGPQLARVIGVAGATVLGDGEIVLIINPIALASREVRVSGPATAATATARAAPAGLVDERPTVMVVDDSLTVRKITGRLLEREGYRVVTAKDGVDALEQTLDLVPDVMLVDIEMPRMDGFDLARNVRSDVRLKNVPIIMITSRIAEKHRNYAKEIGVDHYLGKPYDEEELLGLIAKYVAQPA